MKPLIKILTICYAVLITPFVLRLLYGLWILEKRYVSWGLLAAAVLSLLFALALAFVYLTKDIGSGEDSCLFRVQFI